MPLIAGSGAVAATPKQRRKTGTAQALRQLAQGTDFARRQAALDLADNPDVVDQLCSSLVAEAASPVRLALLDVLLPQADARVADALIAMLRHADASVRSEAVGALQQLPDLVSDRMGALLGDEDPDVRIMAVDVLRLLPHADAPLWLGSLLETETHANVVGVAVDRLAEIGGPDHLAVLLDVRERFADEPYLSFAVDFVIDRIRTLDREARR